MAVRLGNVDPRAAIIADCSVRYERKYPYLVQVEPGEMTSLKNIVFQGLTREWKSLKFLLN